MERGVGITDEHNTRLERLRREMQTQKMEQSIGVRGKNKVGGIVHRIISRSVNKDDIRTFA